MNTKYCTDFMEWQKTTTSHVVDADYGLLAKKIQQAVKFQLPDNGTILEIKKKGTILETYKDYIPIFKLPYDLLVLELNLLDRASNPAPCLILLEQVNEDQVDFFTLIKMGDMWTSLTEIGVAIFTDGTDQAQKVGFPSVLEEGFASGEISKSVINASIEILFCFLAALSCSNAQATTEITVDEKLNKSRIKKGKAPYFSYKVLTINTAKDTAGTDKAGATGKHASPRIHLRRGHIRRLTNKTVWVNACTVGERRLGEVDKSYRVV